jgi:hypothetical protein
MHASETKARAKLAATSTALLTDSLRRVTDPKTPEERMVRAWIIDTLEDRYPDASAAVETAFDSAELRAMESADYPVENVDYVAILINAIPALTATRQPPPAAGGSRAPALRIRAHRLRWAHGG